MLYNLSTHTLGYLKYYNVLSAFLLTKQNLTVFRAEPSNSKNTMFLEFIGRSFDKQILYLFFSRIA